MSNENKNKEEGRISYEPEADVLMWEISREAPIDSAREVGNIVVHFTKQNVPVLIEILNASQFLHAASEVFEKARRGTLGPEAAGA